MKGRSFFLILLFSSTALLLASGSASAWQSETHAKLAEKICRDFNCGCVFEIRDAANIPDREFKDNINHHCYDISEPCEPSKYYSCPKKDNCPAIEKMEDWIIAAQNKTNCERLSRNCSKLSDTSCQKWIDIGIASHYFFDSKVFWHKVQNEDYYKCHEPFEGAVEKKFKANDGSNWTIEVCGAQENYANMVSYVNEFEQILANSGAPQKVADAPLLPECGWWCMIKAWIASVTSF